MKVNRLEYEFHKYDDDVIFVITPCPSRYRLKMGISNTGNVTTIEELKLIICEEILSSNEFEPLKLERGDYKVINTIFPVDENRAFAGGNYEIQAIYAFNKLCKTKGQFPIVGEQ